MTTTLYDIAGEILRIADDIDENGEMPADVESRLDALEMDRNEKIDHLCRYYQQAGSERERFKKEKERLAAHEKAWAARETRIKDYLKVCMEREGMDVLGTGTFKLRIALNSIPSVTIAEGTPIPAAYQKIEISLDKSKVVEAHKAGLSLPAGVTCERGRHLRIS